MNILAILNAAREFSGDRLKEFLAGQIEAHPDLAPILQPMLDNLNAELTDDNIAGIVAAFPREMLDVLEGHIKRRRHAGDSI